MKNPPEIKSYQLQWRFRTEAPPTVAHLERVKSRWLETGELPAYVSLRVESWSAEHPSSVTLLLKHGKPYIGAAGIVDRYADPFSLYLDFDRSQSPPCTRFLPLVSRLGFRVHYLVYRRSQRGWHVIVKLSKKNTPLETVALQAILGSDLNRELYNLVRVMSGKAEGNPRWNLLFERKLRKSPNEERNKWPCRIRRKLS